MPEDSHETKRLSVNAGFILLVSFVETVILKKRNFESMGEMWSSEKDGFAEILGTAVQLDFV